MIARGPSRNPPWPGPVLGPVSSPLPVGSVIAFAGQLGTSGSAAAAHVTTAIEAWGWMLCDGRTLSIDQYQELYAFIGTQYGGSGDGGDSFQIPDLRGYFLRGADPEARNDKDAAKRTPLGTGKAADVGSWQDDALQNHAHLTAPGGVPVPTMGPPVASAVAPTAPTDTGAAPAGEVHVSAHETRPKNISVHYLIRFTNRLQRVLSPQ